MTFWWTAGALFVALAVLGGCYAHDKGWLRRKPPPSNVLAEMEVLEAAARLRELFNATEDHMDVFIRERRQQQGPVWPAREPDDRDTRW